MNKEEQAIKATVEHSLKKARLQKIASKLNKDLDELYKEFVTLKSIPTAEEIVEELNAKNN